MLPSIVERKELIVRSVSIAVVAGLVIGALAWIDPLFIPLVLAGPVISGAVGAARGVPYRWIALAWAVAGVSMVISDWIANHEDRAFHAVLTVVMVGLAGTGWLAARALRRTRSDVSRLDARRQPSS
jgi:hypothetical protein